MKFSPLYYLKLVSLGALLLVTLLAAVVWWAMNDADSRFAREAGSLHQVLLQRLKDNEAVLGGLAALHHAVDDVDYDQLSTFSREMLASYPHIEAVNYLVKVTRKGLPAFENSQRRDGFLTYRVWQYRDTERRRAGPVEDRAFYYPIVFLEPLEPASARLLGYDTYSDSRLKPAIDTAIDTGRITASAPITFFGGVQHYALFKPVYSGLSLPAEHTQRVEQATRMVSVLVRPDRLITEADLADIGARVSLAFIDEQGRSLPLLEMGREKLRDGTWLLPDQRHERVLSTAGQTLRLTVQRPLSTDQLHLELLAVAILLVMLGMTLIHMVKLNARDRQRSEDILFKQKEHAAATLLSIGDAVITSDARGRVEHMNAAAERLTGWLLTRARGRPVQEIFRVEREEGSLADDPVARCLREGRVMRVAQPLKLHNSHGEPMPMVKVTVSPIRNRHGATVGSVLVFHDVSKEQQMQDHIDYQASHDSLTGLLDRREFERCLERALQSAQESTRQHALFYLDLDQFKVINETCGHTAGDELLIQLSATLRATLRDEDVLARLGGDEFAILLMDCPLAEAERKADTVRQVMEDFRFVWHGRSLDVGFGIGVVALTEVSGSTTDVLRAADAACYAAKSRGRHQIFVYQSDDPELRKRRGEMRWATRISEALRSHQFQLYYQPIMPVSGVDGGMFHCELLMRSEDERQQLVSPEEFIPAAERYNLMSDIDRWVVSTALPKIAELDKLVGEDEAVLCGINLSGQSLSDASFYDYVMMLIETHRVDPATICFEITETSAIVDIEAAVEFVRRVKARGCRVALDDFGTGVSSFSYLKEFPLDYVKIDGSFIRNILTDSVDRVMVESVARIAHEMGIETIAEYVEDDAILGELRVLGVDYAQGYGIAEPAPLAEKMAEANAAVAN